MLKINCGDNIALFSDIHFGKSNDNVVKLNIAENFIDWFIEDLQKRKIKHILFLGDWFNNRNSINVHTNNVAYECLKKISKLFKIYIILGNHDVFYKHVVDVNSVRQYGDIKNVTIVEQASEAVLSNGKKILLCPWKSKIEDFEGNTYDFLFGHFDISGVSLYGSTHKGGDYDIGDLTYFANLIFSGHFHIRKEYPLENGKVITVGCPFQLDWGDYNNSKGYYILNVNSNEYEYIKNPISPVYFKYYWSSLVNRKSEIKKEDIENNYVKLVVDTEYDYYQIIETVKKINEHNPITKAEPDYIFNLNKDLLGDIQFKTAKIKMSNLDYCKKFIEKMPEIENIDKNKLTKVLEQYYNTHNNE